MEHHVEVSHPEGSSMAIFKDLLEDSQIQPGMMWSTWSIVTSLFTPCKLPSTGDNNPAVPTNILVASQGSNFKKQLETQSHIKVKCAKQNLKLEFDHELLTPDTDSGRNNKCTATTNWPVGGTAAAGGHMPIVASGSPTTRCDCTSLTIPTSFWSANVTSNQQPGWSHGHLNRSMTNLYAFLQETLRQSQSASNEHLLWIAKACDGKNLQEFGMWLDEVSSLVTYLQ